MVLIISPMVNIISVRTRMQWLYMGHVGLRSTVVRETTETIFAVLYALARIGLLVEAAYTTLHAKLSFSSGKT